MNNKESDNIRKRVENSRQIQTERFGDKQVTCNAEIPGGQVADFCKFSSGGFNQYKKIIDENSVSTRSMDRLAKVSRTVADLNESSEIEVEHVNKSASFVLANVLAL